MAFALGARPLETTLESTLTEPSPNVRAANCFIPMAYTLNGIGTKFYGERDLRVDNSYITTEWIVIFYVPIIPLRSFRVRPSGAPENYQPISLGIDLGTEHYLRERSKLPNWRQVLCVYGFVALCAAWGTAIIYAAIAGCTYLSAHFGQGAAIFFGVVFPLLTGWPPALIPKYLRDRAERRNGVNGYPSPVLVKSPIRAHRGSPFLEPDHEQAE